MLDPFLSFNTPTHPVDSRPVYPTRRLLVADPIHPDDYTLEIDYSTLSRYIKCPRDFFNYSIRTREANKSQSATDFGHLVHKCEETRLMHGDTGLDTSISALDGRTVREHQSHLITEHFRAHPVSPSDHRTDARLRSILTQYNSLYAHDGWPQSILIHNDHKFVEKAFKIPVTTIAVNTTLNYPHADLVAASTSDATSFPVRNIHIVYTGRIDACIRNSNLLWVVDHKTSSRGGSEFLSAFTTSLQTRGYVWAAQKLTGLKFAGLILNALVIKPPTAKLFNNTELDRPTYFYSADSISEFEENLHHHCLSLVSSLIASAFPQSALSFKSPCSGCDYIDNCSLPRTQRPLDLQSAYYRNVTWNPTN